MYLCTVLNPNLLKTDIHVRTLEYGHFVHSMINSKISTVRELIPHFLTTESSVFAENCRYLMYKYDISVFAWYGSLYDVMNCIKNIQNLSNEHASNIVSIKELCKIRDKVV